MVLTFVGKTYVNLVVEKRKVFGAYRQVVFP